MRRRALQYSQTLVSVLVTDGSRCSTVAGTYVRCCLCVCVCLDRWILKNLGDDLTEGDIDDMIADVDTDGSGWVDYNGT